MDKVQHFEIPVDDLERAKKFYADTFGWKINDWPMPDGSVYTAVHTGPVDEKGVSKEVGFINGGMVKRGGKFPILNPTIAMVVSNIDESIQKIKDAGGVVVMDKAEVGGMGYYAYIKDTEGNVVGVWQNIKK